jgi:hypothetical protein
VVCNVGSSQQFDFGDGRACRLFTSLVCDSDFALQYATVPDLQVLEYVAADNEK